MSVSDRDWKGVQKKKVTYSGSENRLCSLKTKIITRTCSMLRIYYP